MVRALSFFLVFSYTAVAQASKCPLGSRWDKKTLRCRKKNTNRRVRREGVEMVKVSPGDFTMGWPAKNHKNRGYFPKVKVKITKAYYISVHEITQKLYKKIMGSNPSFNQTCGDKCPVENVTFIDAVKFCNKLSKKYKFSECYAISKSLEVKWNRKCTGYRLPTEAEWEFAARAGDTSLKSANFSQQVWSASNSGTHQYRSEALKTVKSKLPNAWGIYDMLGNVFEWTVSINGQSFLTPQTDPVHLLKPGSERIFRGGSYLSSPYSINYSYRSSALPGHKYGTIGFRVARSIGKW